MKILKLIAAVSVMAGMGEGQGGGPPISPPPICFSFNALTAIGAAPPDIPVPDTGGLDVHFVALVSASVEQLEVWVPFDWGGSQLSVEIYATTALGVPPATLPSGTFAGGGLGGSIFLMTPSAIAFASGSSYAARFRSTLPGFCASVKYFPSGPNQLPCQVVGTAPCMSAIPPSGQVGMFMRFRGIGCGPGPLAAVIPIGTGCGEASGYPATLSANYPALGAACLVHIVTPTASTVYLFGSVGVNPAGSPIIAGGPCLHYLDQASLAALAAAGAEPIVTAVTTGFPPGLLVGLNLAYFPIPANPALAGAVVGLQALIVGPVGTIALGPGVLAHTTNALQLTVGYGY